MTAPHSESPADRSHPLPADELRRRLDFGDPQLLAECEVHLHRVGGPGGQHRNKVASAVRLCHRLTGFVVTATERRSQHENKANALDRLREAIAIGLRCPSPGEVRWPATVQISDQRLRVSPSNPAYWRVVALVLDVLADRQGEIGPAAQRLGVTSSSLSRFLASQPKAWSEANRIRQAAGLGPLRH